MSRPVWSDKQDPVAVSKLLDEAAEASQAPLDFAPASMPANASRKVLHQAALLRIRRQLNLSSQEEDRILAQEVRAIDDLVRSANLLVERLREWYALHSPEATRMVPDAAQLTKLVAEHGDRASVMLALDQAKVAEQSLGSDLSPEDLAALQQFASALSGLYDAWKALEARVIVLMGRVAPNLAAIVGPVLGARMVALAGGLQRLAVWPSGTIQLLGAETALFRHLKEGTLPPKHGLLYQHPMVHQAQKHHQGGIARAIALAASMGVKADAFTRNDLRDMLKKRMDEDIERVKQRPFKPKGRPAAGGYGRGPPRPGGFNRGPPRAAAGGSGGGYGRGPAPSGPRYGGSPGPRYSNDRRSDGPDAPGPRKWDRAPPAPAARSFPPRDDAPRSFTPRDEAPRPSSSGWSSDGNAPRQGGGGAGGGWTRRDDAPRGPPRSGGYGGGSSSGGSGGAGSGGAGGGYGDRDERGPSRSPPPWKRDGGSGGGGYGGSGAGTGWKPKRKPQGAFRSDNKPAGRPGGAGAPGARDDRSRRDDQ